KPGVFVKETMNALADLGVRMGEDPRSWITDPYLARGRRGGARGLVPLAFLLVPAHVAAFLLLFLLFAPPCPPRLLLAGFFLLGLGLLLACGALFALGRRGLLLRVLGVGDVGLLDLRVRAEEVDHPLVRHVALVRAPRIVRDGFSYRLDVLPRLRE